MHKNNRDKEVDLKFRGRGKVKNKEADLMPKIGLYARKSSEAEDRQVLSIRSQVEEGYKLGWDKLKVSESDITLYSESKSALKDGNRPEFDRLVKDIEKGKINVIICWNVNRLARNLREGGYLCWLLQNKKILKIITPYDFFDHNSDQQYLSSKFGEATDYSLRLSRDVKRGNKSKLRDGHWTTLAPIGYLNNPDKTTWEATPIIPDPDRFHIVQEMWELFLTGMYSVPQIAKIANEDRGFRTVKRKKSGGCKLSVNGIHRIFNNPFYYGYMVRGENEGWGKHKAMISQDDFEKAQSILTKKGGTRFRDREFPFKGIMKCGECGCHITVEDTTNRHGTTYTYYHCTKKRNTKDYKCSQKSVRKEALEDQITNVLRSFKIPEDFKEWGKVYLNLHFDKEKKVCKEAHSNHEQNLKNIEEKLFGLTEMKLKNLLSDDEFLDQKKYLLEEQNKGRKALDNMFDVSNETRSIIERAFDFLCGAEKEFHEANYVRQTKILSALGSEYIIKDKKLEIQLLPLYEAVRDMQTELYSLSLDRLEPSKNDVITSKSEDLLKRIEMLKNARLEPLKNGVITSKTVPDFDGDNIWRRGWDSNPR